MDGHLGKEGNELSYLLEARRRRYLGMCFQQPVLTKRAADSAACARVPKPPLQRQRCYAGAALLYGF